MNEGMEIEVYHHSDPLTKVNTLNAAKDHEFLEELKSTGGGSFKINALDPKILANPNLLAGRNIFKLRVDGQVVSAFIREKRKKRIISAGERKDQDHTISGPGLKAWFDDAEVRPYAGLKTRSQDTRYFNFASEQGPWYISADWVNPTIIGTIFEPPVGKGRPEKWPENTPAKWVWGTAYSLPTMPLGNCYFRYEFTTVGNATYVLYTAADDNFTLYIDGEQRVTTDPAASALYETVRTEFTLTPGPHVIAYRAANGTLDGVTPRGPAAFVAALFKIESDKEVLVTKTGDTGWKVNAYPAEEPGWTAASVLLTLMAEAEARGVRFPTWLNPTFTHTLDSYGLPWTDKMPWSFKVGESLLSVLSSIEELIGDIWIDPDNYDMHFVPQRSFDRSAIIRYEDGSTREAVMFTKGKNLIEADSEGRSKLKNALSVKTDLGWLGVDDDSGSIATYGRLEGTLKVGAPRALSEALADVVISQKRNEEEGATYVILPTQLETPFVKFDVGDYVAAPNEANETVSRRVLSIAVKQSSTGQPEYSVEFDVIFRENEERVNRILNKIGAGGVGGGYNGVTNPPTSFGNPVVIPPPPTPPTLFPLAPTGLVVTSAGNWTPDGVTAYSEITLDWDPVTSNTDGSVTTPEYYEIWGHSTDETDDVYEPFGRTTDTLITIKPFNPGSSWTFKVLARNPSGEASAFSTEVSHTPVGPTAQMTAPSTPVVTSDKGNLIITWDGLLGGVAPPPQFRYVYAKVATTAGGTYTQRGQTLGRGGGNIVISGLTVGQAYHAKLVAVDGAGITSPDSLSASTTLTGISLGSLEADVAAAIQAAQDAADAAQLDADSAFATATSAQTDASTALTAANGKNKIVFSTSAASGTSYSDGDIWFQKTGSTIIGQWEFVSGAWASRTLTNAVISTLDAGKITTGTLAAARIAAGTITAEKLAIGDASNMAEIGANPAGNTVIVSGVTHDAPGPAGGWFQRSVTTGQTHLFRNQKGPLPFNTGDRIRISFDAYASVVDNVQISLYVYGNDSLVQLLSPAFDLDTVADTYTFESDITVDTIGKTSFTLGLSSILAGTQTYLRNVRVYRMNAGELVVDGTITASKLAAESVIAGKVAAGAIAADNIQARAITAQQIASETLTSEEILARSITADRMELGSLTVNELHPSVGADLNISANEAVNILVGQITAVESDVIGVGDTVETLQTYYKFTADGALIESPGSPYSIGIKSDRIQMLQNGVEVSYWNAGVMYVNSFVGESVILGNHQIVKSGTGTIVRKL